MPGMKDIVTKVNAKYYDSSDVDNNTNIYAHMYICSWIFYS